MRDFYSDLFYEHAFFARPAAVGCRFLAAAALFANSDEVALLGGVICHVSLFVQYKKARAFTAESL
jgi:hypothetical protein